MIEIRLRHAHAGFSLDVDITAPLAGVTALFGPSGCGKTTILSAVAGLLRPDAGRIAVAGRVLLDTAARVAVPAHRRRCGVVFQEARLFPHLTVLDNLRYGARRAPRDAVGPGLEEVVALLGLDALLGRTTPALSGGEAQRVALGRALLSRPRLLLLDEPLAALDLPRRAEVLPFLARLRATTDVPMLYVTHALDEVDALADWLVLLEAGRVLASGAVAAVVARTDLPLLGQRRDAGVLLECRVAAQDGVRGLTQLAFAGGALRVAQRPEPVGTTLRLRLRARDVAVATEVPRGLSINNVLPATLSAIEPLGDTAECMLRLDVGPTPLLARVTRDAVARLGLVPGQPVFALVKAVSFDRGTG